MTNYEKYKKSGNHVLISHILMIYSKKEILLPPISPNLLIFHQSKLLAEMTCQELLWWAGMKPEDNYFDFNGRDGNMRLNYLIILIKKTQMS